MPIMELRLERLIDAVHFISNIDDLNDETPIVVRQQDPASGRVVAIACSIVEPTRMILPMNIVWICFDPNSRFYKQALKRVAKNPVQGYSEFEHGWELLYFYEDVFADQFYDPADLKGADIEQLVPATPEVRGSIRLSTSSTAPRSPRVISEGHFTLTNNRDPLDHSHPERPATMIKCIPSNDNTDGIIHIIDQSAPEIGMALLLDSATTAIWRKVVEEDLTMGE